MFTVYVVLLNGFLPTNDQLLPCGSANGAQPFGKGFSPPELIYKEMMMKSLNIELLQLLS